MYTNYPHQVLPHFLLGRKKNQTLCNEMSGNNVKKKNKSSWAQTPSWPSKDGASFFSETCPVLPIFILSFPLHFIHLFPPPFPLAGPSTSPPPSSSCQHYLKEGPSVPQPTLTNSLITTALVTISRGTTAIMKTEQQHTGRENCT